MFPWPLHGGPSIRIFHLLHGLADAGHDLILISGVEPDQNPDVPEIENLVQELHTYPVRQTNQWLIRFASVVSRHPYPAQRFVTPELRELLRDVIEEHCFDVGIVNFLYMLDAVPPDIARFPIVLDQHESEEMLWEGVAENGSLPERIFAQMMLAKIPGERRRALKVTDAILSVSPLEAQDLRHHIDGSVPVYTVPNGVDLSTFEPTDGAAKGKKIVFVAGMGVRRNVDAAVWFADEVFPRIREEHPQAEFLLVGSNPTARAQALGERPGIQVTGTVPDVRPYYQDARCVVLPYRFGAGTKLKLLEAMALARPIITTSKGCHGVDLIDGEHALIRDDPRALAEAALEILSDPDLANRLGRQARHKVAESFSWDQITRDLDGILHDVVASEDTR